MTKGNLYIVSAPSGAGKTSLLNAVKTELDQLKVAVSHTTRAPRPGEIDGEHYHFVTVQEFNKMKDACDFVEYAEVFGNFYGTSKQAMNSLLDQGLSVVLEIDWQGAKKVRKEYPQAISIFILPPSVAELEKRLIARGQDSADVILSRMRQARSEISHYGEYQYLVINDDIVAAVNALRNIFTRPENYVAPSQSSLDQLLN